MRTAPDGDQAMAWTVMKMNLMRIADCGLDKHASETESGARTQPCKFAIRIPQSAIAWYHSTHDLPDALVRGAGRDRVRDDQPPRQAERAERPGGGRAGRRGR